MVGMFCFVLDCYIDERYKFCFTYFNKVTFFILSINYVPFFFVQGSFQADPSVDFKNEVNFLPLEKMDLDSKVNIELRHLIRVCPVEQIMSFRKKCQNFYIRLASEIYSRFPFNDAHIELLQYCRFIIPSYISSIRSIAILLDALKLDIEIDTEYRLFRSTFNDHLFGEDETKFWEHVRANYSLKFPNILELRNLIRTLPHTSAACERIFSLYNANKTSSRNRLQDETLTEIVEGKTFLRNQNKFCYDCKIPESMLKNFNSSIYAAGEGEAELTEATATASIVSI